MESNSDSKYEVCEVGKFDVSSNGSNSGYIVAVEFSAEAASDLSTMVTSLNW